ncbi:hypothetical protein FGB62_4g117 [Gracilaria domingensis]|nr:hypothetical protein FGB62_4g117 [Gracilaria domingensis]
MCVVPYAPLRLCERAVAVVKVQLLKRLIVMAEEQVGPSITIKIGYRWCAILFELWLPENDSGADGDINEGWDGFRGVRDGQHDRDDEGEHKEGGRVHGAKGDGGGRQNVSYLPRPTASGATLIASGKPCARRVRASERRGDEATESACGPRVTHAPRQLQRLVVYRYRRTRAHNANARVYSEWDTRAGAAAGAEAA